MYKVFLVDDEEVALARTADCVPWEDNGFEVVGAESDPLKAVDRIIKERPDVVFLDLKMPVIDGHEVMRRVTESNFRPEFVMLSAYGDITDARTFFKNEGFDYILKPMISEEVDLLLDNLSRRLASKYPKAPPSEPETSANAGFMSLAAYIRENYTENFTLEKLSRRFGISSSYICALFSKVYNTSLSGYVTRLRMEEAERRIRCGKEPFKIIAIACGYKDYYYFSRMFKEYYGMSPSQYRELNENSEERFEK